MRWIGNLQRRLRRTSPDGPVGGDEATSPPRTGISYGSDRPIGAQVDDRFQRWGFAKRIADTIAQRADESGLVVGVLGALGEGKTSVLNLIGQALVEYDHVILIRFNPWYFTSEATLLKGLFTTLAQGVGKKLPSISEEIGAAFEKWGQLLVLASGRGEALTKLGATLATTSLETLRDRVQRILRAERLRIVVLIDDIDRLDCAEIQALFKVVRLSGDFDFVTYVLAFDERIVAASLAERYPGHERAGRDSLEKFIQVPLHLPPADQQSLRLLAFEGIEHALAAASIELSEEEVQSLVLNFTRALAPSLTNPRQARRYANALLFSVPLLKGEVNISDQLLLEGLHVLHPALYEAIRSNPELFLGDPTRKADDQFQKDQRETLVRALPGVPEATRREIEGLVENLFPAFGDPQVGERREASWEKNKRICSRNYFPRYFSYAVPLGDISDLAFDRLLLQIKANPQEADQLWRQATTRGNVAKLIEKLSYRLDDLSSGVATALGLAIAHAASLLPNDFGAPAFSSTKSQAGILLYRLTSLLPDSDRFNHALHVTQSAESLSFAIECFRWFRTAENPRRDRILTSDEEASLGRNLAERIRKQSESTWFFNETEDDAHALLWVWKNCSPLGTHEVQEYLEQSFSKQPERVPRFLSLFTGKAFSLASGLPKRASFRRDAYDSVTGFVPAEVVRRHIEAVFGEKLDASTEYFSDELPADLVLANQFAFIDDQVRTAQAENH